MEIAGVLIRAHLTPQLMARRGATVYLRGEPKERKVAMRRRCIEERCLRIAEGEEQPWHHQRRRLRRCRSGGALAQQGCGCAIAARRALVVGSSCRRRQRPL